MVAASSPRARAGTDRLAALVALGATLARRGPMAAVSIAVSAVTALVFVVIGASFARRGGDAPVHDVPLLASSALAWGGGFLHAFSVCFTALRRDRAEGIHHLFMTRTTSTRGYLIARVGGLTAVLTAVVGGGTLLTGAVSILAAIRANAVLRTMQATVAALVFAVAFAVVIAPIAFAALGARTRLSGYLVLLAVLVLPEILSSAMSGPIPSEVTELFALPSALAALRASLAPGSADPLRFFRALVALALFGGVAIFFLRREIALLELERKLA